ncbi:uncharacterized protein LOC110242848 isoform X2 [Exaiptasia diaphana]|uniref:Uncharacterized protein n=1 Tax=Exaiptasia diaphana TaxID=2652724 RepID=A0A913XGU9_EXADI|nr:uncharacterized protein LOC110242848 isoform X2 [Exaiptasia diaphana]
MFLKQLEKSTKEQPSGSYEPLFVVVKNCEKKDDFDLSKISEYRYEVLGGTHLTIATKTLHEQFPDNKNYFGRLARIYVGLKNEDARWLGAMHNNTGSLRHSLTYIDELEICRTQLSQSSESNENWRDMCSSLLNKPKRNISEIFTMAQICEEAWSHLIEINTMYENGELKDQKVKSVEVIQGKPVLKQWQFKELCSLCKEDRTLLLKKVAKLDMSLEEMKVASKEIKQVKPIQVSIVDFFKFASWAEATKEFGEAVSVNKLLRHAGKDFEQSHDFQTFLKNLKRLKNSVTQEQTPAELIDGQLGSSGLAVYGEISEFHNETALQLPHFEGSFLGVGDTRGNKEIAQDIVKLICGVNYTKATSYNIVLFTEVEDIAHVKEVMEKKKAFQTQVGHFYVKRRNARRSLFNNALVTFVVGHWSVSSQLTSRHISDVNDNVIEVSSTDGEEIPHEALLWLVQHLSREGDVVTEVSRTGNTFVSALNSGRSALLIAPTEEKDFISENILNLLKKVDKEQEQVQ